MLIPWKSFTGEFPREKPQNLPDDASQESVTCDFSRRNLRGLLERAPVAGIAAPGAKSIFVYDGLSYSYYTWNREVDAVRGPVANDAYARFYWADGRNFYVSRGDIGSGGEPSATNRYLVGVPQPPEPLITSTALNRFNINGMTPTHGAMLCEDFDGGFSRETGILMTSPTENTLLQFRVRRAVNHTCPLVDDKGEATGNRGSVVRITFQGGGRTPEVAYLRERASDSVFPPNLSALTGYYTYTGGQVEINLAYRNEYVESRAYTYTYVNQYGEEGPPSLPVSVDVNAGQAVQLRHPAPVAPGYVPITAVRIYRAASGNRYLFVREQPISSSGEIVDDVDAGALGESLSTQDFYPPPQNLRGLCAMPNGVLAAFTDNEIHFSVPYLPYAWPRRAVQTTQTRVMGLCPFEAGLYVTTTTHPLLVNGVDPLSMTQQKIPAIQAGVHAGAFTNVGPYAVYASHDGLVVLRGMDADLTMSFKFFSREVWRERYGDRLSQMRLSAHDGRVVVWFADGHPGFMVRLDDVQPYLTRLRDPIYAATVHPQADQLYVSSGAGLFSFEGGARRQPFIWHSKDFIVPKPTNFGCLQIVGMGVVQLKLYADGRLVLDRQVNLSDIPEGSTILRLPGGFMARRWSVRLEGLRDTEVDEMFLSNAMSELQNA